MLTVLALLRAAAAKARPRTCGRSQEPDRLRREPQRSVRRCDDQRTRSSCIGRYGGRGDCSRSISGLRGSSSDGGSSQGRRRAEVVPFPPRNGGASARGTGDPCVDVAAGGGCRRPIAGTATMSQRRRRARASASTAHALRGRRRVASSGIGAAATVREPVQVRRLHRASLGFRASQRIEDVRHRQRPCASRGSVTPDRRLSVIKVTGPGTPSASSPCARWNSISRWRRSASMRVGGLPAARCARCRRAAASIQPASGSPPPGGAARSSGSGTRQKRGEFAAPEARQLDQRQAVGASGDPEQCRVAGEPLQQQPSATRLVEQQDAGPVELADQCNAAAGAKAAETDACGRAAGVGIRPDRRPATIARELLPCLLLVQRLLLQELATVRSGPVPNAVHAATLLRCASPARCSRQCCRRSCGAGGRRSEGSCSSHTANATPSAASPAQRAAPPDGEPSAQVSRARARPPRAQPAAGWLRSTTARRCA